MSSFWQDQPAAIEHSRARRLSPDEKALRAARIDDWCAKHRVECVPHREVVLEDDDLRALGRSASPYVYGRKKLVKADITKARRARSGGPKPS